MVLKVDEFNSFSIVDLQEVKVLIVEQEEDYVDVLQALLKPVNFTLSIATHQREALNLIQSQSFDLIIIGSLAGEGGQTTEQNKLIDTIRQTTTVPIIALVQAQDEENGSNLVLDGADYDLQKPFTPRRLRAAITAVLRRSELGGSEAIDPVMPETLNSGNLSLSLGRLEIILNGKRISLSAREFSLLQFLMANPDRTFTREELAAQAWGWAVGGEMRAIDSSIKRLRQKVEADTRHPEYIITERNMGYRFNSKGN